MAKRRLVTCTFCGAEKVLASVEDVFPNWLADKMSRDCRIALGDESAKPKYVNFAYESPDQLLLDSQSGTIGANAKSKTVIGERPVAYKLPDVCETCNRGWMGQLEETVRHRLVPGFLQGKTKPLDPYDQLVLAMWVIKTSLTYDACQDVRYVPSEMGTRQLYTTGQPLRHAQVLIGHDENHKLQGDILHGREMRPGADLHCPAASISLQFGRLICWTIVNMPSYEISPYRAPELLSLAPTNNPKFLQIWPSSGNRVLWPSEAARGVTGAKEH